MSDLKTFSIRMQQTGEQIERRAGQLLGEVVSQVGKGVIARTPIREGRARRNWQANKDTPLTTYLDVPATPGDGEKEAILNVERVASTLKSGDSAHITNNAPYIAELNKGSSDQAPAMFVEMEVLRALEKIRGFKLIT